MSDNQAKDLLSEIHHVLKVPRRRGIIQCLIELNDEVVPVRVLSRRITSMEQDICVDQATGDNYQAVYISLIQQHLSQLADANIIEYDSDRKTVKKGPDFLLVAIIFKQTFALSQFWYGHTTGGESTIIEP